MNTALCVGINDYPQAPLMGCINDCNAIESILSSQFDFHVTSLHNWQATRSEILRSLRSHVAVLQPEDKFVFHFSGHGSQLEAITRSHEPDQMDEVICMYDGIIRDNELNSIFRNVNATILVILDCCFSGTGIRTMKLFGDPMTYREKYMRPLGTYTQSGLFTWISDIFKKIFYFNNPEKIINKFHIDTKEQGQAILISGCTDKQTSADAFIGGKYMGALTYVLCKTLQDAQYQITYADLIEKVNKTMDQFGFSQDPQLECMESYLPKFFLR